MYCEYCLEKNKKLIKISNNTYCIDCINTFRLVKCPEEECNNVISLHENENNTCTSCNTIFCNNCIISTNNLCLCNYCINS